MPIRHRILVADDNISEQFLLERALHKVLGVRGTVRVVSSGNEAIAYMIGEGKYSDRKRYPFPTLIITDLEMNDGDGFDVLEFLQNNPAWSVVPRIVFSSSDEEDNVRIAFFLGASAYHIKGADPEGLEKQFRQILEYWATSKIPPVDESGRILKTMRNTGKSGRFPQIEGGQVMRRPLRLNEGSDGSGI